MNQLDQKIRRFVQGRIRRLNPSKAALAHLRRGIGKKLGDMPALLEYVLPEQEFSVYPQQERKIEAAIYTALTLYAFHQQGSESCVSAGLNGAGEDTSVSRKNSFGYAVRNLAEKSPNREGVLRRFNQVMTANDLTELAMHARGLIGMMKQNRIFMDYPSFALDLYHFQQLDSRRNVVLAWGKDFYTYKREEDK